MMTREIKAVLLTVFLTCLSSRCLFPLDDWKRYDLGLAPTSRYYLAIEAADADSDGDIDLLIGNWDGYLIFYRNAGTPSRPAFQLMKNGSKKEESFFNIFAGNKLVPRFADIDKDGDFDLFIGNNEGYIAYFRNEGKSTAPRFIPVKGGQNQEDSFFNINAGIAAAPVFSDVDNDGDLDLVIGNASGFLAFYRNDGTASSALFTKTKSGLSEGDSFAGISAGSYAVPVFTDMDNDGKTDLLIGNFNGKVSFYKNTGTPEKTEYKLIVDFFSGINVMGDAAPAVTDINDDGIRDIIVGNNEGEIWAFSKGVIMAQTPPAGTNQVKNIVIITQASGPPPDQKQDPDGVFASRAVELIAQKDHIEALLFLNKVRKKNSKVKDQIKTCENEIKKLTKQLSEESFMFRDVADNFKIGIGHYTKEKYEKAVDQLDRVLKNAPENSTAVKYKKRALVRIESRARQEEISRLIEEARSAYKKKDLENAFQLMVKARGIDAEHVEALSLFLQFSNELARQSSQDSYRTGVEKAESLMAEKKYEEALKILSALKVERPDDSRVNNLIEICSRKSQKLKTLYQKEMREKYTRQGDEAFGKSDFENAIVQYGMALRYGAGEDVNEKIRQARVNLTKKQQRVLDPEAVKKHFQEGLKFYSLGQYEEAIAQWNRVLELDPQHVMARQNIEKAKKMLGK